MVFGRAYNSVISKKYVHLVDNIPFVPNFVSKKFHHDYQGFDLYVNEIFALTYTTYEENSNIHIQIVDRLDYKVNELEFTFAKKTFDLDQAEEYIKLCLKDILQSFLNRDYRM